jgi:uncharacterized membrane-anchored protein YitT (DUF2179 family)
MGWLSRQRQRRNELFNSIKKKNLIKTSILLGFGSFLSAASVNLFFVPNNFVTGGVTGLGIIANELLGMSVSTFVFFGNLFMIGLGLIFLGGKKIIGSIFGALLYSLFLFLTEDIAIWLNFSFDNILLYALAAGIVNGFAEAIVYKIGYSTGGTSILGLIIADRIKKPIGKIMRAISITIILLGGYIFGYTMVMYAIIIVSISTFMIDKVTLGISDSKMFMVQTSKVDEVKEFILQVVQSGVTEYVVRGGFSGSKKDMLMCVVPTEKYTYLKSAIKEIDHDAFIIVSDCYEVLGGTKRKKLTI